MPFTDEDKRDIEDIVTAQFSQRATPTDTLIAHLADVVGRGARHTTLFAILGAAFLLLTAGVTQVSRFLFLDDPEKIVERLKNSPKYRIESEEMLNKVRMEASGAASKIELLKERALAAQIKIDRFEDSAAKYQQHFEELRDLVSRLKVRLEANESKLAVVQGSADGLEDAEATWREQLDTIAAVTGAIAEQPQANEVARELYTVFMQPRSTESFSGQADTNCSFRTKRLCLAISQCPEGMIIAARFSFLRVETDSRQSRVLCVAKDRVP